MPLFHFKGTLNHGERIRDPPVASGVHPDVFHSKGFEDVDRPGRRALRFRVKGHPSPIALIKDEGGRMLFNVVNDDAATIYVGVVESVDNKARAFKFVLKMGGMNENGRLNFFAISKCSSKIMSSFFVFLLRPISPMPSTFGLSMKSGMSAITSRAKTGSSASFGLMQSQQKCLMPNFAARAGSYSVSWR